VNALACRAWCVLTNDAARLPRTIAARLRRFGLDVDEAHVLSSGMLIAPYFAAHAFVGTKACVLGTDDSRAMVRDAGGILVEPGEPLDVVVIGDDEGYDFLPDIERTLNACVRAIDRGAPPHLILPNPDLVYPKPGGEVGLTAGTIANMIEGALARLRPGAPRFVGLGKPHGYIYDEARRRIPGKLLAVGDQLDTDVAGALAAGLDVAFVTTGAGRWSPGQQPEPTWVIVEP
jgi:glycerol 3-phosphatase-2